ncbi:hypothetical protein BJX64DRAFT_283687 [Aspergillus heterothallicus]
MYDKEKQAVSNSLFKDSFHEQYKQQCFVLTVTAYSLAPINEAVETVFSFLAWLQRSNALFDNILYHSAIEWVWPAVTPDEKIFQDPFWGWGIVGEGEERLNTRGTLYQRPEVAMLKEEGEESDFDDLSDYDDNEVDDEEADPDGFDFEDDRDWIQGASRLVDEQRAPLCEQPSPPPRQLMSDEELLIIIDIILARQRTSLRAHRGKQI